MWILVAVGIGAGLPWWMVLAAAGVAMSPVKGTVAIIGVALVLESVRKRRSDPSVDEADLLRRIASSVAAGATLREAIVAADVGEPCGTVGRLCRAGAPIAEVGTAMKQVLPVNGRRFASLCAMSELTGAPVGDALRSCADRAARDAENRRKLRTSLAQVRMSAWVVGVAPLALTGIVVATRGIPEPGGAIIVVPMAVGFILEAVGMGIVLTLSQRAIG